MGLTYSIGSKMKSVFINYELESQLAIMKQQGLIDDINKEFKGKYFFYELKLSNNTFMSLEYSINSLILMLTI